MGETGNSQNKLVDLDRWLQKIIRTGDIPFLGLYTKLLDKENRNAFKVKLSQSSDPLAQYFLYLHALPALSLIYLTLHVCKGFGTHGTFEVYPFIQDALQIRTPLTTSQKENLWKAYRKACLILGLSISTRHSGTHFMVDEYLRQSGVPIPYVAELTGRMIRYAQNVGLPDDDDSGSIRSWQDGLNARLLPPFSKIAQRAFASDDGGYYVRQFIRILEKPIESSEALSDFEILMSEVIHKQTANINQVIGKKGLSLSISQVMWRDNQVGVEIPAGAGVVWEITVGSKTTHYVGQMENRFVPLEDPLPPFVEVVDSSGRCNSCKTSLWEDEKNNRLLLFLGTGIFYKSSRLNSEEQLLLEPGEYQLVLRFIPDGLEDEIETVRSLPELYVMSILLEPGQELVLNRGPASIALKADSKPLIVWAGESFKGVRGNEVYCSNGLRLRAMIPEEFFVDNSSYFIQLSNPMEDKPLKVALNEHLKEGDCIDITQLISGEWKPKVTRLLAEIYREGIQRPLVRSTIMVWIGLKVVEARSRFLCTHLPSNLIIDESDNLSVSSDKCLISYLNDDNRYFRMVFDLGNGKKFVFTLAVPGIFLQLRDYSVSPETERSLKKGSIISVSWNSRCVLEIYSTCNGYLQLGSLKKYVKFNNCGCKRLPLSGLIEYLRPESNILLLVDESTGCAEELLHLVAPYEILQFSVSRIQKKYHILFSLPQITSQVCLKATDLLSGKSETLFLGCDQAFESTELGINGLLTCNNDFNYDLQIFLDSWPNGAWIIDLESKINGRWGRLANQRGDLYSAGFILLDGIIAANPDPILSDLWTLGLEARIEILQRINEKLLPCYAQESWQELKWLENLRYALFSEFKDQEGYALSLIALSENITPEGVSCSWVPIRSVSSHFPWIYSLPAHCYREIPSKSNSLLIKCLTAMSSIKYGPLTMFKESALHRIFAFGFNNVQRVRHGDEPHYFCLKKYEKALKSQDLSKRLKLLKEDDWQPGKGDYLGALHYLYAIEKLGKAYLDTRAGNEFRRRKALYLCRSLDHWHLEKLPAHLDTGSVCLNFINNDKDDELCQNHDNILKISRFLSLFARVCRWETRQQGCLTQFLTRARQSFADDDQFESVLGYLLYIGKNIFGFYLLLWEAVFTTDYNIGEKRHYVRKQSADSL